MEDFRMEEGVAPVFKLADLAHLYKVRLEQLGVANEGRVHTSRLKLRLLSVFPDLTAHLQGRNVMLSFNDIGDALKKASHHDSDVEILTIEHFQLSGLIETYLSSCMHTLSIYKRNQLLNYYHTFVFLFWLTSP